MTMTAPLAKTTSAPDQLSQGFNQQMVTVASVDTTQMALCVNRYGQYLPLMSTLNLVGSGQSPQAGETWLVNRENGGWTFKSRVVANPPTVSSMPGLINALGNANIISPNSTLPNFSSPPTVSDVPSLLTALSNADIINSGSGLPNYADYGPVTATITAISGSTVTVNQSGHVYSGVSYLNSYSPTVGDSVVMEWVNGNNDIPIVLGATTNASADVPVGGIVAAYSGPASTLTIGAGTTNFDSLVVPVVAGHRYTAAFSCGQAQQITNAASAAVQIYAREASGTGTILQNYSIGLKCFIYLTASVNQYLSGTTQQNLTPGSTVTNTLQLYAATPVASLSIGPQVLSLTVTRVA